MKVVRHDASWLFCELDGRWQTLGWPVLGAPRGEASAVGWLKVRNQDLGPEVDPLDYARTRQQATPWPRAPVLMTSASLDRAVHTRHGRAEVLATVGLSNGLRVDAARGERTGWGTINVLVALDAPLSEAGALETLCIAAQARTAAVMESGAVLPDGRVPTGTGTDCLMLAWPSVGDERWAGLHTELGQYTGAAVYAAVHEGALAWLDFIRERGNSPLYPQRPSRRDDG